MNSEPISTNPTILDLNLTDHLNLNSNRTPPIPPRTYTPLTQEIRSRISQWVDDFHSIHPFYLNLNQNQNQNQHQNQPILNQSPKRVLLTLEHSALRQRRLTKFKKSNFQILKDFN